MSFEVSNRHVTPVCIRNVIERSASPNYPSSAAFAEGKAIGGNCVVSNIANPPVCASSLIASLLYKSSSEDVRFIMVAHKPVELPSIANPCGHRPQEDRRCPAVGGV